MADRVLITGGLGFVGYHLARHLLRQNPAVRLTLVDNLSSTQIPDDALWHRARVRLQDFGEDRLDGECFEHIYHLAGPVGSVGILARAGSIVQEILRLTHRVTDLAVRTGARLLVVSSSEVYGRDGVHEEDACLCVHPAAGARTEYALGKMAAEVVVRNLARLQPLHFNVCRPFNVIGEHQSAAIGFVVPTFFECALTGRDLPVHAPGTQRRAFCHVSDLVRGMVAIQESGVEGEVFNVGNDRNVTAIADLARRIRGLCGSTSRIVLIDSRARHGPLYSEAFEKIPSLARIRARLGWEPVLDLETSLARILAWYRAGREGSPVDPPSDRPVVSDAAPLVTL